MDRTSLNVDRVLERAWLYADPDSFRQGVLQAVDAIAAAPEQEPARENLSLDRDDLVSCAECQIPFDEDEESADSALCPFCGARRTGSLQDLTWAELKTVELVWPDAVGE
jgi:hypothetical protein